MNRDESILKLATSGMGIREMMDVLGYKSDSHIYTVCKRNGIKLQTVQRNREKRSERKRQERAEKEQQRKLRPKPLPDGERFAQKLSTKFPEWEYVGGYTGSEGTAVIRHKVCGYTVRKSVVTIRHHDSMECKLCAMKKKADAQRIAQEEKEAREQSKRIAKFLHQGRHKQIVASTCEMCGCFFVSDSMSRRYCDDCTGERKKHKDNMKKRRRYRDSWTKESKSISLRKLYKRDNGICWICGKPCDCNADSNSNYYPSIDHIKPIALGGKDEWSNIKLAHRICNSLRGAESIQDYPTV